MRIEHLFPAVAELRPDDVLAYLRSRGWALIESRRSATIYGTDHEEVLIPLDPTIGDYARRLGELVEIVAAAEGRPIAELIDDLSLPPGDTLAFCIQSESAASGSLPLAMSAQLRDAQKNLLLAAAHSALSSQRYFPRMTRAEPIELLNQIRDGQTRRGSYISTVFIPVEPTIGQFDFEAPYGRRVSTLLMETLSVVSGHLDHADDSGLLTKPPPGISYNLMAALANMKPIGERSTLSINMRWSRARPLPPPHTPNRVTFREPQFSVMRVVAKALRESAPASCEIEGYIARLSRQGDKANAPGEVVIIADIGDTDARVHVDVSPEDYNDRALPAHRDGRRVRVAGVLRRDNKKWKLTEPNGFEAFDGGDDTTA